MYTSTLVLLIAKPQSYYSVILFRYYLRFCLLHLHITHLFYAAINTQTTPHIASINFRPTNVLLAYSISLLLVLLAINSCASKVLML